MPTLTFPRTVLALTLIGVFAMSLRVSADTDTWWHLRAGKTIIEQGRVLDEDPFSLTRQGAAWHYPGWLAQVVLFGVFSQAGLPALNLLTALIVTAAFACVWASLEGGPLLKAAIVLLAAATSAVYWSARPHLFTLLLTAAIVWIVQAARKGRPRRIYLAIPVMALWTNLHGGFIAGFVLLGIAVVEAVLTPDRRVSDGNADSRGSLPVRPTLIALGGSLLAACLNPFGPEMLLYPFRTVSIGVLQDYIQEWQSPNFHQNMVWPFLLMILLLLAAFAVGPRRPTLGEVLSSAAFLFLGLWAGRNIALFALAVSPGLAAQLNSWVSARGFSTGAGRQLRPRVAQVFNIVLVALVVAAAGIKARLPLDAQFNEQSVARVLPVEAAQYLRRERLPGPLFNSYNWGGYVLWELYPQYRSFVDGRTDLFDDDILTSYLEAWRGKPEWRDVFREWDIRIAFLEPDAPLVVVLESAGWLRMHSDSLAVVLVAPETP
jgi:hypothetical protein